MAKKQTTKKKATAKKTTSKEVAVVNESMELMEGKLSASALASLAGFEAEEFKGVDLDVTENKELFANDIVIPKIWLIQAMSELRKKKVADEGDYVDSRSEEILLAVDDKEKEYLPIIPIKTFKRWQTFKIVNEKKEFVSSEIMQLGVNENLPYKETVEGEQLVRRQVISAYVLLGEDAQKQIVKPYIVDFAATSKGAGRDLVSDISVLNAKRIPSWAAWFKLGQAEDKIDKDDFFIKTCKFGGPLPKEMYGFLRDAYEQITSMIANKTIEIDDRDVHDSAKAAAADAKKDVTGQALAADAGI